GLLYDSSLMADDEPYELLDDGQPTGIVELPVEWIKDDAPYLGMNRATAIRPYTAPSAAGEIFRAEFEGALAEGGLFLLTMHPHIIGHRSRIAMLDDLIRYMKGVPGVWFATHEEVARYCKAGAARADTSGGGRLERPAAGVTPRGSRGSEAAAPEAAVAPQHERQILLVARPALVLRQ